MAREFLPPVTRITEARSKLEALIDKRIYMLAPDLARQTAANMPPGGLHPLEMIVVSPSASTSADVGTIPALYKCNTHNVLIVGDSTGTATIDIWRARPNETTPSASIFGGDLPQLTSGRVAWVNPTTNWVRYIEPNTVLFYYVTAVSGPTRLDIALNVRCLTA